MSVYITHLAITKLRLAERDIILPLIEKIYMWYNPIKLTIASLTYFALFGLFIKGYVNKSLF